MEPYQDRVVTEEAELDKRIDALSAFLIGRMFISLPEEERERMHRQFALMYRYRAVLRERIEAFPK
jgi:hypothetical protein